MATFSKLNLKWEVTSYVYLHLYCCGRKEQGEVVVHEHFLPLKCCLESWPIFEVVGILSIGKVSLVM